MSYRKKVFGLHFWMLPAEEGLPFGEIDIMEYIDCWSSKEYQINVHVTDQKKWESYQKK